MRRRRLPAEQVVWLVIGMALMRDRPITDVAAALELCLPSRGRKDVAPSAIVSARARLGAEPVAYLFERTAQKWAYESAAAHRWRELSLFSLDGTTLRVADSDENREHFGLASGGHRGDSGYPMVRLVCLMALRSHLLADVRFGPYKGSELGYAKELVPLQRGGQERHWLTRTKSNTKWRIVERLGPKDVLVELTSVAEPGAAGASSYSLSLCCAPTCLEPVQGPRAVFLHRRTYSSCTVARRPLRRA